MKRSVIAALALAGVLGRTAGACEQPSLVDIPDGATSSLQTMLRAQAEVRAYVDEMVSYLACVNNDIEAVPDATPAVIRALVVERYNAAVKEMETVAAAFYEQRVAYSEANPQSR